MQQRECPEAVFINGGTPQQCYAAPLPKYKQKVSLLELHPQTVEHYVQGQTGRVIPDESGERHNAMHRADTTSLALGLVRHQHADLELAKAYVPTKGVCFHY